MESRSPAAAAGALQESHLAERCSICYESLAWRADEAAPHGIRCEARGHFVHSDCLALLTHHELDTVRLAKTFGAVGCPDPGCTGPDGGVPYADAALCAALGGEAAEPWRSFVAARASLPLQLASEQPPTDWLVELSPQLAAVEPWLRCLEMDAALQPSDSTAPTDDVSASYEQVAGSGDSVTPRPPPLRVWACRGFGGGDGNEGGSAGGLGVQLWPAAITLAARTAAYSQTHRSVCDLGCGVGLVGLAWLHAAASHTYACAAAEAAEPKQRGSGTGAARQTGRRRLVLTDGDSECLALARCNIKAVERQHAASWREGGGFDATTAVLRWGDVEAARALSWQQQPEGGDDCGFDLVLGTDLLYFAGAEVAQRLAVTIAALLSPPPSSQLLRQRQNRSERDRKAVLANHGGWFDETLEQCLRGSAVRLFMRPMLH